MKKQGVYLYTRVSTAIQTEGYSLEAQRQKLLDYAKYRGFAIRGEYSDAGFSGKNIAGRAQFQQMLDDIASKKDDVDFVLVFKLSRFGRNAADVLSSLQFMQDYGVNLICVEDNIDSSADSGKLMISVMSAMAEIERENILVQTMSGRRTKAANGGWNGGFAPYGYELKDGILTIVEDEAKVIRDTFELYVGLNKGATYVAQELNRRYNKKIKLPKDVSRFTTDFVKRIVDNPIYMGKIAYGRTVSTKIEGKRNEYHRILQKDEEKIILSDGKHEAIVPEELWQKAHDKRQANAFRPEKIDQEHHYILSGLVRCPNCGSRMYGRMNGKQKKKDGTLYAPSYSYICRTRRVEAGITCSNPSAYAEKKLLIAVRQIITSLVKNDGFHDLVERSLHDQFDPSALNQELETTKQELKRLARLQQQIENQLNCIDYEEKNAYRLEESLNNRLFKVLDDIEEAEERIASINERLENAEMIAQTKRGIYLFLEQFDTVYDEISDEDKKAFLRSFIESIEVYPKNHPSKLLIKRINFNFPIAYKNGKEYSSIAFYNGNDDDDDNGPDGGGNGGNNGDINGGGFRALSGDCLHIDIRTDELCASDSGSCAAVEKRLGACCEVHRQIFNAVLIPTGVRNFPRVYRHGLVQISRIAAQNILTFV